MQWLLLNQFLLPMAYRSFRSSVLEEVVSSEQQLVQVLVSGRVSSQTMNLLGLGQTWNNLESGKVHLAQD